MNSHILATIALLLLAAAVMIGGFGAHALEDTLGDYGSDIWKTASIYHFIHGLGAVILIALDKHLTSRWIKAGVVLHLLGIILFSGSLYLLALTGWQWLGPATPFGGLLFIAGWIFAAIGIKQILD